MQNTPNPINQRIAGYRKLAGYNQAKAAEMLGLKRNTYARMERHGNPSPEMLARISELYRVSVDKILYGDNQFGGYERVAPPKLKSPKPQFHYSDLLPLSFNEENIIRVLRLLDDDVVAKHIEEINKSYKNRQK